MMFNRKNEPIPRHFSPVKSPNQVVFRPAHAFDSIKVLIRSIKPLHIVPYLPHLVNPKFPFVSFHDSIVAHPGSSPICIGGPNTRKEDAMRASKTLPRRSNVSLATTVALFAVLFMMVVSLTILIGMQAEAAEWGEVAVSGAALLIPKSGDPAPRGTQDERSLSPYFVVLGDDVETDALPLKHTAADVVISGVIAEVTVTQLYANDGEQTLEAIYVFPGSTRAAVQAMRMTIGERRIQADIKKRAQARREYEQARADGKTAALLEQQRPNVFQMNVANILPGDEIKVEMVYTELLVPEEGIYEFVYPTVVGPRYHNQSAADSAENDRWIASPYLPEGEKTPTTFALNVDLRAGMPLARLASPSHDIEARFHDSNSASLSLPETAGGGNKDFVLRYMLAGDAIQSGLLLYPGEKEHFFLMMMEPPERVEARAIVPREYIFIIDISGSMHGFPLDTTKALMRDLFGSLSSHDYFNVMLFAGSNSVMSPHSLPATPANINKAIATVENQRGGGGTELIPALKRALALPQKEGSSRTVVIATDGYVSVEKDAFELIANSLGNANLFAFGIGSSVNRFLIEGIARAGLGEPFVVLKPEEAKRQAARFREYIASPVLTDIRVAFDGVEAYDVEPVALPDLFARRPLVLFGKYKGEAAGTIRVTGSTADGRFEAEMELEQADASVDNRALRQLWARKRIERLADMNKLQPDDKRVEQVTELGLAYSLLTDYTSFVAVDSEVRGDGTFQSVKQPLPLPEGVSNHAVGAALGRASAAPALKMRGRSGGAGYGGGGLGTAGVALEEAEKSCDELSQTGMPDKKAEDRRAVSESRPKARLSVAAIEGPLSKAAALKVLKKQQATLMRFYRKELAKLPNLKGDLKLRITLDAKGRVTAVALLKAEQSWPELERFAIQWLKAMRFPAVNAKSAAVSVLTCRVTLSP